MRKTARTSLDVQRMLRDLDYALQHPELIAECQKKKPNVYSLWGFSRWARWARACKVCQRKLPIHRQKTCSNRCRERWEGWKKARRARRRGITTWFEFSQMVERPLPITALATKLNVSVDEARRRAEVEVRRGRMVAYRGRTSPEIREIGVPKNRTPPRKVA